MYPTERQEFESWPDTNPPRYPDPVLNIVIHCMEKPIKIFLKTYLNKIIGGRKQGILKQKEVRLQGAMKIIGWKIGICKTGL